MTQFYYQQQLAHFQRQFALQQQYLPQQYRLYQSEQTHFHQYQLMLLTIISISLISLSISKLLLICTISKSLLQKVAAPFKAAPDDPKPLAAAEFSNCSLTLC